MTNNVPTCEIHNKPMSARKGKYGPFWSCGEKDELGNWCKYKPSQGTPAPNAGQIFGEELDKSSATKDRDSNIKWMNAINNATLETVARYNKGEITSEIFDLELERAAINIYKMRKPDDKPNEE